MYFLSNYFSSNSKKDVTNFCKQQTYYPKYYKLYLQNLHGRQNQWDWWKVKLMSNEESSVITVPSELKIKLYTC